MLTTQKYGVITQRRIQKYEKKTKKQIWQEYYCEMTLFYMWGSWDGGSDAVEAHSSPEYHQSSKYVEGKKRIHHSIFRKVFPHCEITLYASIILQQKNGLVDM